MKTLKTLKKALNNAHQKNQVSVAQWNTFSAWVIEAWKAHWKSQTWQYAIELPQLSCYEYLCDEDGMCIISNDQLLRVNFNQHTQNQVEETIQWIEALKNEAEYLDAAILTAQLLLVKPESYAIRCDLADLYLKAETYKPALNHLKTAIESSPAQWRGYWLRAQAYQKLGWFDRALDDLDTALLFAADPAMVMLEKSNIYWSLGEVGKAIRAHKTALNHEVDNDQWWAKLAARQYAVESFQDAYASMGKALELNPFCSSHLLNFAISAQHVGKQEHEVKGYLEMARDLGHPMAESLLQNFAVKQPEALLV